MDFLGTPNDQRCHQAREIAQSALFDEDAQLAWASAPIGAHPSAQGITDLTHALIDAVDRQGCPEFIHALLMSGADPLAKADEGSALWRHALRLDASRPASERSAWMLVAAMAFGSGFPSEPLLHELQKACQDCIAELESLYAAQDEHFKSDPGARSTGELYAILDARHDCAFAMVLVGAAKAGARRRQAKGRASE